MAISDTIKKGMIRAPHRSLLRATGVVQSEADFDKPFIAVANSFVQIVPGPRERGGQDCEERHHVRQHSDRAR